MTRRVIVDLTGCFRGPAASLRRRWADVSGLAPLHRRIRENPWFEVLPTEADVRASAVALASKAKGRPVLVGQAGVVDAARAWVEALHLPLDLLFAGPELPEGASAVVAHLGPAAVDDLVDQAVERKLRVAVVCAPVQGEAVEPPPRGVWVNDAWAGEGTRGALGAGVLVGLTLAGLDLTAALRGAQAMLEAASGPIADNPAWSVARALRLLAAEGGRDVVIHVAGEPRLLAFASWAARAQAAQLAGMSPHGPARPLPAVALAGDAEWGTAIGRSARDRVVLVWESVSSPQETAWFEALGEAGVAVIRIRLPALDAESVGGALTLWLRGLGCLAAMEERGGEGAPATPALSTRVSG